MNIKTPTLELLELENDMCLLEDKLQFFETWEAPALSRLVVAHGFQFQFPNIKSIFVLDIPLSLRTTDFCAHLILLPKMLNLVNLGTFLDKHQRFQPTFARLRIPTAIDSPRDEFSANVKTAIYRALDFPNARHLSVTSWRAFGDGRFCPDSLDFVRQGQ